MWVYSISFGGAKKKDKGKEKGCNNMYIIYCILYHTSIYFSHTCMVPQALEPVM